MKRHISPAASVSSQEPYQDAPVSGSVIIALLATLESIPRGELPDGEDRDALAALIMKGEVDNLYTPLGHAHHVIAWAHLPAWVDPRQPVADWLMARRSLGLSDEGGRG